MTEDQKRIFVKKELRFIGIVLAAAALISIASFFLVKTTKIPFVSVFDQIEFYRETADGNNFGPASYKLLKYGQFKWDKEITEVRQYSDITETRKAIRLSHAKHTAITIFTVIAACSILTRYLILFFCWLYPRKKTQD